MSNGTLRGQVGVITGASSGIGRAIALALAREGVDLVLVARNQDALEYVRHQVEQLGAHAWIMPTDVSDAEQVRRMVREVLARFGKIDLFVANAGIYPRCPVCELRLEDIERVMAVNFYGSVTGILEVLPSMTSMNSGHIVVISSIDGKKGVPPDGAYVASKFALSGFTEVLRQELHGTGIHLLTVFPGRVDTPMIDGLRVPLISASIPPEKVAEAVVRGIVKRRNEVLVPYLAPKALILVNALSARIGDWFVRVLHLSGWDETPNDAQTGS
jgi:hypothetical protein